MDVPRFDFDFSFLDLDELRTICISADEIEDTFYTARACIFDYSGTDGFAYCVGYSPKRKFISFIFDMRNDLVRIINVWLPDEHEIRVRYYEQ